MTPFLARRHWLALATAALAGACANAPAPQATPLPPVVFVHGNGDSAALWTPTLWRYESQGWPRARLHAVDFPNPLARDDDGVAQPGRSSAAESAQVLAAEVDAVLARTGARQVVLVGNSRGGLAIRNYIKNYGGAAKVSHAVLGGTPNHGVWSNPGFRPNNEFNGAGPFLTALNAPQGPNGDEVTPGVAWMTLRSDGNDKFAQPDGVWIGARGTPTNVTAEGPALKGAKNVVLPGRDHREVSYHPEAFAQTVAFITGRAPQGTAITPEAAPVLDGRIAVNNLPVAGASIEVFVVDPATGARQGPAVHRKTVGTDGRWGPFTTRPTAYHEFVVSAPGAATAHVYRSPFPRSSSTVHFRPERLADADKDAASVVTLTRPRGYFGLPRDRIVFDGNPPPGIPTGVAGLAASKLKLRDSGRSVVAEFSTPGVSERLAGIAWPAAENRVVVLELQD
jgi:pimeloyl-ACP methyl ester carboxylesterase